MIHRSDDRPLHPRLTRRTALGRGAAGLGALGAVELAALPSMAAPEELSPGKSVIFIFLTGGLSQHDSFDMKPNAPADVRGEFRPIATRTPGIQICEHLPLLAERSRLWTLVRSMVTDSSGHEPACHMLLTGRRDLPPAFTLKSLRIN